MGDSLSSPFKQDAECREVRLVSGGKRRGPAPRPGHGASSNLKPSFGIGSLSVIVEAAQNPKFLPEVPARCVMTGMV